MKQITIELTKKEYLAIFESYLRNKSPEIFNALDGNEASVVIVKPNFANIENVDIIIKVKEPDEQQSAGSGEKHHDRRKVH